MKDVIVRNLEGRTGNAVPNQFVINVVTKDGGCIEYFQSYTSIIAKVDENGQHYLDKRFWDFSNTTGRYRNQYLGETRKETEKHIKDGTYKLVNLN